MPLSLVGRIQEIDLIPAAKKRAHEQDKNIHYRNRRKAMRNWRVLMDRFIDLVKYVGLHEWVSEWLSIGSLPEVEGYRRSIGTGFLDAYAILIKNAEKLTKLKSKESPAKKESECLHPTQALRGGGNRHQSYVACGMCHSRWKLDLSVSEIKEMVKSGKPLGRRSRKSTRR